MSFVHEQSGFDQFIRQVSETVGVARAQVEKDYWITHVLWALHASGLEIWFKGGTSLSKGFGIIQRFSEDLDLRLAPGTAAGAGRVHRCCARAVFPAGNTRGDRRALQGPRHGLHALGARMSQMSPHRADVAASTSHALGPRPVARR